MSTPRDIARHAALDARLVSAVRGIRLLDTLSWPASAQETFLGAWKIGRIHLPEIVYPKHDHSEVRAELDAVTAAEEMGYDEISNGELQHDSMLSARRWP